MLKQKDRALVLKGNFNPAEKRPSTEGSKQSPEPLGVGTAVFERPSNVNGDKGMI